MIIAGVGCRSGTSAQEIDAAIDAALAAAGLAANVLAMVATSKAKAREPGIAAAAVARGVPFTVVPTPALQGASSRTISRSEYALALAGVPSVSEAAALAAGGPTARLLAPRIAVGRTTCALADTGETP